MKVAVVVKKFPVLSETFVLNHINLLIEAGVEVKILSYQKNRSPLLYPQFIKNNLQELTSYGEEIPASKILRIKKFITLFIKNIFIERRFKLVKTLNIFKYGLEALNLSLFFKALMLHGDTNFDIIHSHFGPTGEDVRIFHSMGLISGKMVVSFHGYDFLNKNVLGHYKFYENLFNACEGIIANSSFTKEKLIRLGCKENKIKIFPVIPSVNEFVQDRFQKRGFKNKPFRILTVARLVEKKGIQYAINAVELLKKDHAADIRYTIIGDGPLKSDLLKQVQLSGLSNEVNFVGPQSQDEIAKSLTKSDLFLLPSIFDSNGDTETQGLVLIEAQLMGVPVVATKVGGIPDSVKEGVSALLVEEKDSAALSRAIYKFYNSPELRNEFGFAGQNFVLEMFDAKSITRRMILFYGDLPNT